MEAVTIESRRHLTPAEVPSSLAGTKPRSTRGIGSAWIREAWIGPRVDRRDLLGGSQAIAGGRLASRRR